jgi:hypothetical protein
MPITQHILVYIECLLPLLQKKSLSSHYYYHLCNTGTMHVHKLVVACALLSIYMQPCLLYSAIRVLI